MTKINDFDGGLRYVSRMGFTAKPGVPGWIVEAQARMCDAEDALFRAAGGTYPFTVHYFRKKKRFLVNGEVEVDARRI
jgi:hypothetical protein